MVTILKNHGTEKMLVNSAADWGKSDPLKTRKVADAMLTAGFTEDDVDQVLWRNPVAFYGQSGRLQLDTPPRRAPRGQLHPARRGVRRCASATRTGPSSTSPTAPTSTPPRPWTASAPSSATTANPYAAASAGTGSASASGSPGTPPAP